MSGYEVDARCADSAVHSHDGGRTLCRYGRPVTYRHTFQWRRPRVVLYWAAKRRAFWVGLNRYPGVVIGAGVQVGQRVVSLVWGRAGAVREES